MAAGKSAGSSASRYGRLGDSRGAAEKASWEDADQEELWRTIIAVTEAGDALTLSKTMDGGAVSLTILSGSERIRNYAHGADEIADLLARIRVTLEATD